MTLNTASADFLDAQDRTLRKIAMLKQSTSQLNILKAHAVIELGTVPENSTELAERDERVHQLKKQAKYLLRFSN